MYGQQTLHQESCFYQIASIIFLSERLHTSRFTVPPVWVSAFKAVRLFQETDYFLHAAQPFFPADVSTIDTRQYGHDAEAASS